MINYKREQGHKAKYIIHEGKWCYKKKANSILGKSKKKWKTPNLICGNVFFLSLLCGHFFLVGGRGDIYSFLSSSSLISYFLFSIFILLIFLFIKSSFVLLLWWFSIIYVYKRILLNFSCFWEPRNVHTWMHHFEVVVRFEYLTMCV